MSTLPPLPDLDPRMAIGYEHIRYIAGYTETFVKEYATAYAQAALSAQRERFSVAVGLLRECLGPLEVSAALIESDDTEQMEALIASVQKFVQDADRLETPNER